MVAIFVEFRLSPLVVVAIFVEFRLSSLVVVAIFVVFRLSPLVVVAIFVECRLSSLVVVAIFVVFRLSSLVSSPGPKVHVNYCHHLASVVRRLLSIVCCLSSVNFSHFKLLLRNHLADWYQT